MPIALTRPVSAAMANCELTHLERQPINIEIARQQHRVYEECLASHGYTVVRLHGSDDLPDSVFIEDTAIVLDEVAIITLPGAVSRRAEIHAVAEYLAKYRRVVSIQEPGTLDGGDVLRIGANLYVGISQRTNTSGFEQLVHAISPFGYSVSPVNVRGCLHLKSAVTQVAEDILLINREWLDGQIFEPYHLLDIHAAEPFAANALKMKDGAVIVAAMYSRTASKLQAAGIRVVPIDVTELAKAEGGVTCCSLLIDSAGG